MLLRYQKENLKKLKDKLNNHNIISIVGKPNSGRTEVAMHVKQKKDIVIKILPKRENDPNYEDMLSAIKNIKSLKKNKHGLNLELSLAYRAIGITLSSNSSDIFFIEHELTQRLKRLSYYKNIIFIVKNPSLIDDGTNTIINSLLKRRHFPFLKKRVAKIEICDDANEATGEIIYFEHLSENESVFLPTLQELNLNPEIKLSRNVVKFIFKNANGNISLLSKIVNDLNTGNIDNTLSNIDKNCAIKELISYSVNSSGFSDKLYDILTILSICDRYFSSLDISFLLEEEINIIELYLKYGVNRNLFYNNENHEYQLLFAIIKKIFSDISNKKRFEMYNKIIKLISTYYPDNYHEKYIFANLANNHNAKVYLIQDIMKNIRDTGMFGYDNYANILTDNELKVINSYHKAYYKSCNNQHYQSIQILEDAINNQTLYSPIKQEFQLLLSQCLIKSTDFNNRNKALDMLCYDNNDKCIDEYLKYRIDTRRISALIHNGEYRDAQIQCDRTENRLITIVKNTKSPGCEYFLNVIYRKYCNVHSYESSIANINNSIKFFSANNRYVRSYYIALNNALALNLINGQMNEAKINIEHIQMLKEKYFNVRFPRPEILKNNMLVYDLIQNITALGNDVIKHFEILYNSTKDLADNILIASNYSICLALNGKISEAVDILSILNKDLYKTSDAEGIYIYRVSTNLAICIFIQDNTKKTEALTILHSIKLYKEDMHYWEREKELKLVIKTMEKLSKCTSAIQWIKAYQSHVDTPLNYYRLYQYGFVFTTLFDWDDE